MGQRSVLKTTTRSLCEICDDDSDSWREAPLWHIWIFIWIGTEPVVYVQQDRYTIYFCLLLKLHICKQGMALGGEGGVWIKHNIAIKRLCKTKTALQSTKTQKQKDGKPIVGKQRCHSVTRIRCNIAQHWTWISIYKSRWTLYSSWSGCPSSLMLTHLQRCNVQNGVELLVRQERWGA